MKVSNKDLVNRMIELFVAGQLNGQPIYDVVSKADIIDPVCEALKNIVSREEIELYFEKIPDTFKI